MPHAAEVQVSQGMLAASMAITIAGEMRWREVDDTPNTVRSKITWVKNLQFATSCRTLVREEAVLSFLNLTAPDKSLSNALP